MCRYFSQDFSIEAIRLLEPGTEIFTLLLSKTLLLLAKYPSHMDKLREDLQFIMKNRNIITLEDIKKSQYIQAVVAGNFISFSFVFNLIFKYSKLSSFDWSNEIIVCFFPQKVQDCVLQLF